MTLRVFNSPVLFLNWLPGHIEVEVTTLVIVTRLYTMLFSVLDVAMLCAWCSGVWFLQHQQIGVIAHCHHVFTHIQSNELLKR